MGRDNGNLSTLKPQPGQSDSYNPTFHPLPGVWAKEQIAKGVQYESYEESPKSSTKPGLSTSSSSRTEIQRALADERSQHRYWEEWQGVTPGKPVYEDPRAFQNTLLPVARYGTDGRGD
jgi:hypothetical protein